MLIGWFCLVLFVSFKFLLGDSTLARHMLWLCVCLSVCLTVRSQSSIKIAKLIIMQRRTISVGFNFPDAS